MPPRVPIPRMSAPARRAMRAELAVMGVAALYRGTLQYRVPRRWQVPANLAVGAISLGIARAGGASAHDMGLARERLPRGLAVGATVFGATALGTASVVAFPLTRHLFADPMARDATARHVAYESVVRIPLGTAVFEEALFRGAMYGLERQWLPRRWRLPWNCLHFGLWHIPEGVRQLMEPDLHAQLVLDTGPTLAGTVLATGLGGAFFHLQRDVGGSLVAPMLGHSASNVSAYLGALATVHIFGERPPTPEEDALAVGPEDAVLPEKYELPPLVAELPQREESSPTEELPPQEAESSGAVVTRAGVRDDRHVEGAG